MGEQVSGRISWVWLVVGRVSDKLGVAVWLGERQIKWVWLVGWEIVGGQIKVDVG